MWPESITNAAFQREQTTQYVPNGCKSAPSFHRMEINIRNQIRVSHKSVHLYSCSFLKLYMLFSLAEISRVYEYADFFKHSCLYSVDTTSNAAFNFQQCHEILFVCACME